MSKVKRFIENQESQKNKAEIELFFQNLKYTDFIDWMEKCAPTISISDAWNKFLPIDTPPELRIKKNSAANLIESWLQECLLKISLDDSFYFSTHYNIPWAKIKILDSSLWINELWTNIDTSLGSKDFVILKGNMLYCFFEEEDYYEFFSTSI